LQTDNGNKKNCAQFEGFCHILFLMITDGLGRVRRQ
jgi:hypothetical protein